MTLARIEWFFAPPVGAISGRQLSGNHRRAPGSFSGIVGGGDGRVVKEGKQLMAMITQPAGETVIVGIGESTP